MPLSTDQKRTFLTLPTEIRLEIVKYAVLYSTPVKVRRPRSNKRGRISTSSTSSSDPMFGVPSGTLLVARGLERDALMTFLRNNTFDFRS